MKAARYGRGRFTSQTQAGSSRMPNGELRDDRNERADVEAGDDLAVLLEQAAPAGGKDQESRRAGPRVEFRTRDAKERSGLAVGRATVLFAVLGCRDALLQPLPKSAGFFDQRLATL